MSDHPGNQLVVRDTFFPVCGAEKSFMHPSCVLGSPLGGWRNLLADAAPCYGAGLGESEYAVREDVEMASSSLELEETKMIARSLEIMAFGSGQCNLADTISAPLDCSRLQQSGCNQVFRGSSDYPQLWMHNNAAGPSGPIMPDQTPELSRRLIVGPDTTCLASRGLGPASLLAPSSARQSLDASAWSLPMTSLQLRGRSTEPGHGLGIVNSQEFVSQYSFDPAFAARAAKCASVRREAYSDFSNSPTPLDDPREMNCCDGAFKNRRPKKLIELASSCSSQGLPSLLTDRRTAKFTLGSTRDVKARKFEIQDECTSEAGELVDEDRRFSGTAARLCSPYTLVEGKACGSQESEHQTKSFEEATSGTRSPHSHSSGEELEAQDTVRLKRVRTAENEERVASMQPNQETNAKNGAPVRDSSLKRQKSLPTSKWKEEPKTEDNEQKNDESGGESSPKAGKFKATKPLEAPKLDYIHVRARRGQATDSHSLAERARREKISERMRFLQDLVPGCSKITGKAMMLDEIINYVQSLQHQVEFLAMKLAALNPRLDFNRDSFLERQFASALDEINGAVPELATSAGPQITTNFHMQMQSIRTVPQRVADEADYGVPTSRDISTENCNPITGISHGSSWERNLPYD